MRGFRRGDPLICDHFNFVMESVVVQWHYFSKKYPCADDIDTIRRTKRDVTASFSAIERLSTKMGLAVKMGKTKYMLSTSRDVRSKDSQNTADNYTFETVKEFV